MDRIWPFFTPAPARSEAEPCGAGWQPARDWQSRSWSVTYDLRPRLVAVSRRAGSGGADRRMERISPFFPPAPARSEAEPCGAGWQPARDWQSRSWSVTYDLP